MKKTLHLSKSLSIQEREEIEHYISKLSHEEKNELLEKIISYIRLTTS